MPESGSEQGGTKPHRAGAVLGVLILVAAVANLNLSVANVALPDIGKDFAASQTELNLVAVGYSLGLAASVLYLGALGDRHGRKRMVVLGMAVTIPASLIAGLAPSVEVLFGARVLGGLAAGMAFPTTLALITALWSGADRTKAIALWSAIGGALSALGPMVSGALLEHFDWGSCFLVTLPLAAVALIAALRLIPAHVNETTDPVDNLGGMLSILMVAALVLGINFAAVPGEGALVIGLLAIALAAVVGFVIRQRRVDNPLYDLNVAARPTFWVAAAFIGQQVLQNVLESSTFEAGVSILPAAALMIVVAPRSAGLVEARGARFTLLLGYVFILAGFLTMLLLWSESSPYWHIGLAYGFVGIGIGFAGTPASHSLTGSVPVDRAGMASATADLQRDLGGAIMQSILGAVLTAGYAASISSQIAASPNADKVTDATESELQKSFSSAADLADQYPQYKDQIIAAARDAFLQGDHWAYVAGIAAILIGAFVVFRFFPRYERERELMAGYAAPD